MERQNELQHIIDNYLLNRLTPEQETQLQRELADDPRLQEELDASTDAIDAIDVYNDVATKERLQRIEAEWSGEKASLAAPPVGGAKVIRMGARRWWAAAAAILLLLAAGWFFLDGPSGTALNGPQQFAANFEPYRNVAVTITRGAADPTPEELAYAAYEAGDWPNAATALAELPANPVNQFYRAQVALAQQEYDRAANWLEPVATAAGPLRPVAEWYLALAELGRENTVRAQELLQKIATTPNHPFAEQAGELIE